MAVIPMTAQTPKPRQRVGIDADADADVSVDVSVEVSVQAAIHACAFTSPFTVAFNAAVSATLICLGLAGCASPLSMSDQQARAPAFRDPAMSIESANAAIAIGTSTRAEVLAVLGPGTVVTFDSGFEIWVYRGQPPDTASNAATKPAELVILFAPSGVVKKTRIKPVY